MKKLLYFVILIILAGCSHRKEDKINIPKTNTDRSVETWTEYITKDSIPKLFHEALVKLNKGNFELADLHERFNATDVLNDSLPRQKLSLLSNRGDQWRLTYVQGGFGKYYVYAQCEIRNDSIYNLSIAESVLILENNDSIDKYLFEEKLKPKYVKIKQ